MTELDLYDLSDGELAKLCARLRDKGGPDYQAACLERESRYDDREALYSDEGDRCADMHDVRSVLRTIDGLGL